MEKKRAGLAVLMVMGVAGMGLSAHADDTTTTAASASANAASKSENVSQTVAKENLMDLLHKKVEFSYFGIYRGASVGDLGNSYQPNVAGNPDHTAPQGVESYVTTGYKFAPDWMAGVTWHFFTNGVSSMGPANQPLSSGQEWLDPMLTLSKANLIHVGNFKLKGYMYVTLPTSSYDYISEPGNNMLTALSPTVNMTYDIPGTRWTLGTYDYIEAFVPGPNTPDGLRTYKVYVAPYVNYQATKRLAATLWVDLIQVTRNQGTPFVAGMDNPDMDIEPGINYDLIPGRLSVNPVLNIYPAHATLASTSLQAVIIGTVF